MLLACFLYLKNKLLFFFLFFLPFLCMTRTNFYWFYNNRVNNVNIYIYNTYIYFFFIFPFLRILTWVLCYIFFFFFFNSILFFFIPIYLKEEYYPFFFFFLLKIRYFLFPNIIFLDTIIISLWKNLPSHFWC
jgi:hypothetical protein